MLHLKEGISIKYFVRVEIQGSGLSCKKKIKANIKNTFWKKTLWLVSLFLHFLLTCKDTGIFPSPLSFVVVSLVAGSPCVIAYWCLSLPSSHKWRRTEQKRAQ